MTNTITRPDLDQRKLDEFMGRAIGDLSSTVSAALTVIGDQLGLYRSRQRPARPLLTNSPRRPEPRWPTSGPGPPTRQPAATSVTTPRPNGST